MTDQSRVAIVTGAARGIGAAIATRLAADGHAVGVVDLDQSAADATAEGIRSAGGRAFGVAADVSNEQMVAAAVDAVTAELGPPTILVNNAGITRDNLIFKMSVDDWDAVMNVHLKGSFFMTRAVQRHMVEQKYGRIVNMSSISAMGERGQVNYAAAKAGLQGFTRALSIELGKFGITANAIAPGFVVSEMTSSTATRMGITFEQFIEQSAAVIPVGRVGYPEDVAHVASFLASEGTGYLSGQVIYLTGGPRT